MFDKVWIIARKELTDNLRDRRSTILSLLYPLIGPVLLGALVLFVGSTLTAPKVQEHVVVAQGSDNAPEFVAFVREQGADVVETEIEDVADAVRKGMHSSILVFPEDFADTFGNERNAEIKLFIDSSRLSSIMSIGRTVELINRFNRNTADTRLTAHEVDPQIAYPLTIKSVNVAASLSISGIFLNMMAPFLMFNIFIGGVYLAIDATAGERERGSLEPLLANPVPRWQFMLGKYIASFLFTALAVLMAIVAYKSIFSGLGMLGVGIKVNPGLSDFTFVFILCIPIMLMAVATVSKSFKETQTYLGLLPLLPALPGMIMVFVPIQASAWAMMIPTYGQTILIGQLVRGETPDYGFMALSCLATTIVAMALLVVAARLYNRENMAFAN
jgi:sodium transport system permease protein